MDTITLINKVKYSKTIYTVYNYLGSKCVSLLKRFIHPDDKLIIFASFGGRKFDDSPKAIYEEMLRDNRFNDYRLVWAFMKPENYNIPRGEKVKIDTFNFYKKLLKARVWVTNSSMTRGLNFSGINSFELNTWHGSAIKKMGSERNKGNSSFGLKNNKKDENNQSIMLAQGQYDIDVFSRAFNRPLDSFRITGLPRNDELTRVTPDEQSRIKEKLGIAADKKVILYAPTFREYDRDKGNNCIFTPPINLQKWRDRLGHKFVLLFRAHYEVAKEMEIADDDIIKDVSSYPNLNELMIASDILVSDYSSIFFDYSIQEKPMLCFAYDYDKYDRERGMYFDIRESLEGNSENEDQLFTAIQHLNWDKSIETTRKFRNRFIEKAGDASLSAVNIIWNNLNKNRN